MKLSSRFTPTRFIASTVPQVIHTLGRKSFRWARRDPEAPLSAAYVNGAKVFAFSTLLIGLFGTVGWLANKPILAQGFRDSVLIAPRAAFLFILIGLSFFLALRRPESPPRKIFLAFCGLFALWISVLNHVEFPSVYAFLEPMLLRNLNVWEYVYRDRMSPLNVSTFILLSPALILWMYSDSRRRIAGDIAGGISLLIILMQGILALGYTYGTPFVYPIGDKPTSFMAALAFVLIGISIILGLGPRHFPLRPLYGNSVRARLLRTFLPIGIASIFIYSVLLFTVFRSLNPALTSAVSSFMAALIVGGLVARSSYIVSRQIEHAVRESEMRFSNLVENLKDYAVFLLDPKGHVTTWNAGAQCFKGYESDEIIGQHFEIFYTPEDRKAGMPAQLLEQAGRQGSFRAEGRRVRKDGSTFWADVLITAIYDEPGKVRNFSKVVRDISDKKEAEVALRQKTAFIQMLQSVSQAANNASTLEGAMQVCLELVCRYTEWTIGHGWILTADRTLVSSEWFLPEIARFRKFKEATEAMGLQAVSDLPGRVLSGGGPVWVEKLAEDTDFVRKEAAQAAGLRAGCAFPVLSGTELVGVLEFFSDQVMEPYQVLLDIMHQVGTQLGRVSERQKSQTHMQASLMEKEVLLKEIHHRVKNNLQIVSSLLRLQADRVEDSSTLAMLQESQDRVASMALIHEYLYQSPDLANIKFSDYVENLVSNLTASHGYEAGKLNVLIDIDPLNLDLDVAIPCGLIITELVSNALKYAFPFPQGPRELQISFHKNGSHTYDLKVKDNGVGLPEGFQWESASTLGLRLVRALTHQLGGSLKVEHHGGTEFHLAFQEA